MKLFDLPNIAIEEHSTSAKMSIRESLETYRKFCEEFKPDELEYFGKPATSKEIAELEAGIGHKLPADLKTMYSIYNGIECIYAPTDEVCGRWGSEEEADYYEADDPDFKAKAGPGVREKWQLDGWIEIAPDGGGNAYCYDTVPASGGRVGQIVYFNHEDEHREVKYANLEEYLHHEVSYWIKSFHDNKAKEDKKARMEARPWWKKLLGLEELKVANEDWKTAGKVALGVGVAGAIGYGLYKLKERQARVEKDLEECSKGTFEPSKDQEVVQSGIGAINSNHRSAQLLYLNMSKDYHNSAFKLRRSLGAVSPSLTNAINGLVERGLRELEEFNHIGEKLKKLVDKPDSNLDDSIISNLEDSVERIILAKKEIESEYHPICDELKNKVSAHEDLIDKIKNEWTPNSVFNLTDMMRFKYFAKEQGKSIHDICNNQLNKTKEDYAKINSLDGKVSPVKATLSGLITGGLTKVILHYNNAIKNYTNTLMSIFGDIMQLRENNYFRDWQKSIAFYENAFSENEVSTESYFIGSDLSDSEIRTIQVANEGWATVGKVALGVVGLYVAAHAAASIIGAIKVHREKSKQAFKKSSSLVTLGKATREDCTEEVVDAINGKSRVVSGINLMMNAEVRNKHANLVRCLLKSNFSKQALSDFTRVVGEVKRLSSEVSGAYRSLDENDFSSRMNEYISSLTEITDTLTSDWNDDLADMFAGLTAYSTALTEVKTDEKIHTLDLVQYVNFYQRSLGSIEHDKVRVGSKLQEMEDDFYQIANMLQTTHGLELDIKDNALVDKYNRHVGALTKSITIILTSACMGQLDVVKDYYIAFQHTADGVNTLLGATHAGVSTESYFIGSDLSDREIRTIRAANEDINNRIAALSQLRDSIIKDGLTSNLALEADSLCGNDLSVQALYSNAPAYEKQEIALESIGKAIAIFVIATSVFLLIDHVLTSILKHMTHRFGWRVATGSLSQKSRDDINRVLASSEHREHFDKLAVFVHLFIGYSEFHKAKNSIVKCMSDEQFLMDIKHLASTEIEYFEKKQNEANSNSDFDIEGLKEELIKRRLKITQHLDDLADNLNKANEVIEQVSSEKKEVRSNDLIRFVEVYISNTKDHLDEERFIINMKDNITHVMEEIKDIGETKIKEAKRAQESQQSSNRSLVVASDVSSGNSDHAKELAQLFNEHMQLILVRFAKEYNKGLSMLDRYFHGINNLVTYYNSAVSK